MHSHDKKKSSSSLRNDSLEAPEGSVDLEDMMGMPCEECERGLFDETEVTDEEKGILHCDRCGAETPRYMPIGEAVDFYYDTDSSGKIITDDYYSGGQNNTFFQSFFDKTPVKKCTDSHPPLALEIDGNNFEMYGSSCAKPIVKDADLYISLDYNAPVYQWEQPWYRNDDNKQHLRFFIEDMSVPDNAEDFKDLVAFTINALADGKKVHAGCIAGHGRTGTLLAAVAQETLGDKLNQEGISAIDYVRSNYCKKAVETLAQVLFLNAEFGIAIPRAEEKLVIEFKEMFQDKIGFSYDEIVKKGEFMATVPIIDTLEAAIYKKHNPPAPVSTMRKGTAMTSPANTGLPSQPDAWWKKEPQKMKKI